MISKRFSPERWTTKRAAAADRISFLPDDTRRDNCRSWSTAMRVGALNTLEMMVDMAEIDDAGKRVLKPERLLTEIAVSAARVFDNKGDRFTTLISALRKSSARQRCRMRRFTDTCALSLRAAIRYICRPSLSTAIASEDVGNADPAPCRLRCRPWDCFTRVAAAEANEPLRRQLSIWPCAPKVMLVYSRV